MQLSTDNLGLILIYFVVLRCAFIENKIVENNNLYYDSKFVFFSV